MKKSRVALIVAFPLLAATAITAAAVASRSDCRGTKICPLTGKVVVIDQCPSEFLSLRNDTQASCTDVRAAANAKLDDVERRRR